LNGRGLSCLAQHCGGPWWHDDLGVRITVDHGAVDVVLIIRAVAGERGHGPFDLVEQWAYLGRIIDIVRRQRGGDNLARVSVHADMQLPP
jgi:hypothetical protein